MKRILILLCLPLLFGCLDRHDSGIYNLNKIEISSTAFLKMAENKKVKKESKIGPYTNTITVEGERAGGPEVHKRIV